MMLSRSVEFWVVIQITVDLCLIVLFVIFLRQVRDTTARPKSYEPEVVTNALGPLLEEAHEVGRQFEAQLKEKQDIVRRLNEHLDGHIIGLNLLLNRAEACLAHGGDTSEQKTALHKDVYDLQQDIITLSEKGLSARKIADRLGIAEGEVTLVLDLKNKLREMEQA